MRLSQSLTLSGCHGEPFSLCEDKIELFIVGVLLRSQALRLFVAAQQRYDVVGDGEPPKGVLCFGCILIDAALGGVQDVVADEKPPVFKVDTFPFEAQQLTAPGTGIKQQLP